MKAFESDKIHSTYWWVIKLDHSHQANYNKEVKEITGYSKSIGHDEARDKAILIMKKIVMLHSHAYFDKSLYILIYMRCGEILDKSDSILLFKLMKTDYEISKECMSDQNFYQKFIIERGVIIFLKRFYEYIANKKDIKSLIPNTRTYKSKDEYFDIAKQRFHSRIQLHIYCEKLIKSGHPYGVVTHFVKMYEEKWFNKD